MMLRILTALVGVLWCCAAVAGSTIEIGDLKTPVYIASVKAPASVTKPFFVGDVLDSYDLSDANEQIKPYTLTLRFTGQTSDGIPQVAVRIVRRGSQPAIQPDRGKTARSTGAKQPAIRPAVAPAKAPDSSASDSSIPEASTSEASSPTPADAMVPFAEPLGDGVQPDTKDNGVPKEIDYSTTPNDGAALPSSASEPLTASAASQFDPDLVTQGWQVKAIAFEGNEVSRRSFMLDELRLKPGDSVDGKRLDDLRQALMNTGLYRSVQWRVEPAAAAPGEAVTVTFVVDEPFYYFGHPELSINGDRETTIGVVARARNLFGLNHSLDLKARRKNLADDDKDSKKTVSLSYSIPTLLGSDWGGSVSYGLSETKNTPDGAPNYIEGGERFNLRASKRYRFEDPNQRLKLGLNAGYWGFKGEPDADGQDEKITGTIGADVSFSDMRFLRFSELGSRSSVSLETSLPGGDFDFQRVTASTKWFLPGFEPRHSNWVLGAKVGMFEGGPGDGFEPFSLSASNLRGVRKGEQDGGAFYALRAEYRTPIFGWDNVRAYTFFDVAEVSDSLQDVCFCDPQASVGFGVRWRVKWFVDLEIGLGIGYHLNEGSNRVLFDSGKFR